MSHSTVLVIIPKSKASTAAEAEDALDALLEPFDENEPVDPYPEYLDQDQVDQAMSFYREHPEFCTAAEDNAGPTKPFDEFVGEGDLEALEVWTLQAIGGYHTNDREGAHYDKEKSCYFYDQTYNPNSRWDWWQLGGRWNGYFQIQPGVRIGGEPEPEWRKRLNESMVGGTVVDRDPGRKEAAKDLPVFDPDEHDAVLGLGGVFGNDASENFSGRADLARKKDIDFVSMRAQAGLRADEAYDKFEEATKGLVVADRWEDVLKRVLFDHNIDPDAQPDPLTDLPEGLGEAMTAEERQEWLKGCHEYRRAVIDIARKEYREQPWAKALAENKLSPWFGDDHDTWHVFEGGRTSYVQEAIDGTVATFAVLKDGTWYEKGQMGWFGMAHGEKDAGTWHQQFAQLIDSLDDDDWLAVVDVHI